MVRYTLDPEQTRFTVQAFAGGILSVFAHNPIIAIRNFTGELRYTPETFENASFQMTVKTDSLVVTDNVRQQDRAEIERAMRTEVLEAARFPEIKFQSTEISANKIAENWYRLQLNGQLSLRGVTNRQPVDAQLRLSGPEMRLSGACTLLQSAYKIKRVSAVGGTITLKDELKFSFDLFGRKEDG